MKKLYFLVLALAIGQISFSQTFMHGVGVNTLIAKGGLDGYNQTTEIYGSLMYSPRINFMESDNTSLSFGIPMSLGFSGNYSSQGTGSGSLSVMFDAPFIINYNYGAGSTKETDSRFGLYGGVGYGYHTVSYTATDQYETYSTSGSGWGPTGNIGFRFGVGAGTHNIEIRLSYLKLMNDYHTSIYGIGGIFNF